MKSKYMTTLLFSILFTAIISGLPSSAQSATTDKKGAATQQPTFATPEAAAAALIETARTGNRQSVFTLIGQGSANWLPSGNAVVDHEHWTRFLAAYDQKHTIDQTIEGKATLLVGEDAWPFPAPLIRHGDAWLFDAKAGREEIIHRRIGRNELDAMQTLLAVVDAQREYASSDPDGNGFHDYARRFISSPGKRDGLYWPTKGKETLSPLGPLVGEAAATQAKNRGKTSPRGSYHGYRYRLLEEGQGESAPGGAYGYRVDGKLIGGFAIITYPEKQNLTGVTTFMVNHDGVIYEKNLGTQTESRALRMKRFNPDATWRRVQR